MDATDHNRPPGERQPGNEYTPTPEELFKQLIPDARIDERFAELMQSLPGSGLPQWIIDEALPELQLLKQAEHETTVDDLQRARNELLSAHHQAKEIVGAATETARAIKDQALDQAANERAEARLAAERERLAVERDRLADERSRLAAREAELNAREQRVEESLLLRQQQLEFELERGQERSRAELDKRRLEMKRMDLEMEHAQVQINRLKLEGEALLHETFRRAEGMSPKQPQIPPRRQQELPPPRRLHALEGVPQPPGTAAQFAALPIHVSGDVIGHDLADDVRAILVIMTPGGAPALGLSPAGMPELPTSDDLSDAASSMSNWRTRLWCNLRSRAQWFRFTDEPGRIGFSSSLTAYAGVAFLDVSNEAGHAAHEAATAEHGPLDTLILDEGAQYNRSHSIPALELEEFPSDKAEVTFERRYETVDASH